MVPIGSIVTFPSLSRYVIGKNVDRMQFTTTFIDEVVVWLLLVSTNDIGRGEVYNG